MKLVNLCYLNLTKNQKKYLKKYYPYENKNIKKNIYNNREEYCKFGVLYHIYDQNCDDDYTYHPVNYYLN